MHVGHVCHVQHFPSSPCYKKGHFSLVLTICPSGPTDTNMPNWRQHPGLHQRGLLRTTTNIAVHREVCVSTLFYGSEAWTAYYCHIRHFDAFNIRCLQCILAITWQDPVPHADILQRTESISIEAILMQRQLRWVSRVIRMPGCHLPPQVLYGQLLSASRMPVVRICGIKISWKEY